MRAEFSGVIEVPEGVTLKQVKEFVEFHLGASAMLNPSPISDKELRDLGVSEITVMWE